MNIDNSYYFLSTTAQEVWKNNDTAGQHKMYSCLDEIHKESFFRRVIYKSNTVAEYKLRDIAENVFLSTWEAFNENGKAGKINFSAKEYTGYFFMAFKNNYLKSLARELRQAKAEKDFGKTQPLSTDTDVMTGTKSPDLFSVRTQTILNKISPDCRQLLQWKHIEGLSHDEIASRKNINRLSSIKMVSRCGKRFSEMWSTIN